MADKTTFTLAELPSRKATHIHYTPNAAILARIADDMGLLALRKLRFEGTLQPIGNSDWRLDAQFGVTVVQACVITLEPVTTRIEEPIARQYLSDWRDSTDGEGEIDGDDISEPAPESVDLIDVIAEALELYLPAYPRVEGAILQTSGFTEPGVAPMTDEDAKPFAGLAGLKAKLEGPDKS